MTGLVNANQVPPEQLETPLGAANVGYAEDTPVSAGQDIGATFMSGISRATWNASQRNKSSQLAQEESAPLISAEDANKRYGPVGPDGQQVQITDKPLYDDTAELIGHQKAAEMDRNAIIQRYSQQNGVIKSFGAGVVGTMLDPANVASMFVPGVGEEATLARIAKAGLTTDNVLARTAARAVTGATGAVAGQTPLDLLKYGMDKQQASDYDLKSAFKDMFFAAAGGAVIHAGIAGGAREFGLLKPDEAMNFRSQSARDMEAVLNADATQKAAAMKSAVSQMIEGREVDVEPAFPMEGERGSNANISDVAERQQNIYREGFAQNMTSNELENATHEILPSKKEEATTAKEEPQQLDQAIIDRYKGMVNDIAQKNGVPLPDDVLDRVSRKLAEEHNPQASKAVFQPEEAKIVPEGAATEKTAQPLKEESFPSLPQELSKASPRYGKTKINFQSDVDKALYIVREESSRRSPSHDKYVDFLKKAGLSESEIRRGGRDVLSAIKNGAKGKDIADIPRTFKRAPQISDAKAAESLGIETRGLNSEKLHDEVTAHRAQVTAESKFSQELGKESEEARSKYEPERGNYANETTTAEPRSGNAGEGQVGGAGSDSGQGNTPSSTGTGEPITERSENGANPNGSQPGETGGNANGSEGSGIELHPEEQAIADMESKLDMGKLTAEERADLAQTDSALRAANDLFKQKQEEYASCLSENI